jgi:hypothetical protein
MPNKAGVKANKIKEAEMKISIYIYRLFNWHAMNTNAFSSNKCECYYTAFKKNPFNAPNSDADEWNSSSHFWRYI